MSIYSLAGRCPDCLSNDCPGCDDREEPVDPCPSGWIDPKLKPNERDVTPNPQAFASPLAVLISARAVTVAKDWTARKVEK